ncbi:MAG: RidA family protein [Clostridia bacterium]|nr:RidA family protein [Clostridia bacterium]MBP5273256.1 RidA family protein [Clostridia bacterium]MBP5458554.1 RidA family protein [Clostridia bacterium]
MNTIHTDTAPAALGPYSQAVTTCKLVFTSGQIAIDPAAGKIVADTIEGQTEQVCKNLGEVLKAAGTDFDHVLKTTCFLKNISDFAAFNAVYAEYFTSKPARSCVAAADLPAGALVEVECIAEAGEKE